MPWSKYFVLKTPNKKKETNASAIVPTLSQAKYLYLNYAAVVAPLAERLLLIPEVIGSNPVIDEFFNCIEKAKNKVKEAGNVPLFYKKNYDIFN